MDTGTTLDRVEDAIEEAERFDERARKALDERKTPLEEWSWWQGAAVVNTDRLITLRKIREELSADPYMVTPLDERDE